MAIISNTVTSIGTGSAGGNREDLEDIIWELDPLETHVLSTCDRVDAKATYHEWELDAMVAPGSNIDIEGNDGSFSAVTQPTRAGNYCQISSKLFLVSGTQEKVAKAGRKSDVARQLKKQMMELKNDMEYALVRNQASSAGGSATGRSLGSMESWIASTDNSGNGLRATTTASASTAAFGSSVVTAPTDGSTTGPVTEAKFKEAFQLGWQAGGSDHTVLVSATQKTNISAFTGLTTKYADVKNNGKVTINASADVYVSEYGTHSIVLHRHVRSSVILVLDLDYWAVAFLRAPFSEDLAKTGDAQKKALRAEYTLVSRNHKASSKIAACA
jgi:hypothetical protein